MKISNEVKQRIYSVLSITLFATILTSIVNDLCDFQVKEFPIFIIAIISMIVLYMVCHHKKIFLALLFSVLVVIGIFLYMKKVPIFSHIQNVWSWLANYANGTEELHRSYGVIMIILIQVIGSIMAKLLCKKDIVKYGCFVGAFIAIIVMSILGFSCTRMLVVYTVLANLIILVEIRCNQMEASKEKKQVAVFQLLPICFIIVICVAVLPMRKEPIQWTGIRKAIMMIQEKGEILSKRIQLYFAGKDGSYEMSFAGYSDGDTELGGEIGYNNGVSLKLNSSIRDYPTYLIGNVKNIYTGSGWKTKMSKVPKESSEYTDDVLEFVCALSRYPVEDIGIENIIKKQNLEIVYEDIFTITKFYPLKTFSFVDYDEEKVKTDKYANLQFKNLRGEGTNYLTYYYSLNLDSESLKDMLRDSDTFTYEGYDTSFDKESLQKLNRNILKLNKGNINSDYIKKLQERRERIYKDYTSLPKTLPDRVYELAEELTRGLTTDYDKMKAIEGYLNSMTYTTKMIRPDEGEDFVDCFLFEKKEGYCTYFASSMAVMGRCLGIPTRYVEGFYVDYKDKQGRYYTVKNSDAHAWVEVYFDGVGWIPFEPTPGYVEEFYKEWEQVNKTKNNGNTSTNSNSGQGQKPPESLQEGVGEDIKIDVEKKVKINTDIVFIILGILGIIVALFMCYYLWLRHKMRRLYNEADNAVKAVVIYRKIMYHLSKVGFPYSSTETLQVYTTRMDECIA
ncbi:transglutaminase-like domain-containing protein, partial [Anaerosporobacter sp.]